MCGRISIATRPDEMVDLFHDVKRRDRLETLGTPKYNIGPTINLPAIRTEDEGDAWALLRWGLIPRWAKDLKAGYKTINARAETVAEKPAFRDAYRRRRCLLPISSFYEWRKTPSGKQPFAIRIQDEEMFTLAGLWEEWTSPDGEVIESCTVVTTEANALMSGIHDRMPVIVDKDERDVWLRADPATAAHVMRPYDPGRMEAYKVSTFVSNVRNEGPECIAPLAEDPPTLFG